MAKKVDPDAVPNEELALVKDLPPAFNPYTDVDFDGVQDSEARHA